MKQYEEPKMIVSALSSKEDITYDEFSASFYEYTDPDNTGTTQVDL